MTDEVKDPLQDEIQDSTQNKEHINLDEEIHNPVPSEVKLPWYSCLNHPIKTVESWGNKKVSWLFIIIASCIWGIDTILSNAYAENYGEHVEFRFILFITLIGGPIMGIIGLLISSSIMFLVGKIFRGKASFTQIFNASVISVFPFIFLLPIWLLQISVFGENLFKGTLFTSAEGLRQVPLFIGFNFLVMLIASWSFIVFIATFCFVNQFKLMKKVFYILAFLSLIASFISFFVSSSELLRIVKNGGISEQNEQTYELTENDEANKALLASEIENYLENEIATSNNINSNDTNEYINLGNTYYESGQYEEALDAYLKATELGVTRDTAHVYYNIGVTYYDLGRYADSIFNFKQYLQFIPYDLDAYWYMVYAYEYTGNLKLELEYLDKIIALDPSIYGPIYKGDLLSFYGNYSEALTIYEEVIESFPQYPDGYYGKAQILSIHNQPEEAVSYLEKAYEIDSSYTEYALEDPMLDQIRETKVFKEFTSKFSTIDIGTY